MIMEVNNGIIINGVLHEFVIPSESPCLECSLKNECGTYLGDRLYSDPCDVFNSCSGIFVLRAKVKIETEDLLWDLQHLCLYSKTHRSFEIS